MPDLIVALDVASQRQALELVDELGEGCSFYKVGLELFTQAGPGVVRALRGRGKRVFLDLKLLDIPATVAGAVHAAAGHGADLVTVHATGGQGMLAAAVDAAAGRLRVLGVTVLTSLGPEELARSWGRSDLDVRSEVVRLGEAARSVGVHGLVSSAAEVGHLRLALGPDPYLVTPGIRLPGGAAHDQRRVATPAEAVAAGADALVLGRAVTASGDRVAALGAVRAALAEGGP